MTKQSVVIYPSDVEREAEKLYDELIDLGRRDPKGADRGQTGALCN